MSFSFYNDFPVRYVCCAMQLHKRGYYVSYEGTNAIKRGVSTYQFIPSDPAHRGVVLNPLYGMVEGRNKSEMLDIDISRIFGVPTNLITLFSDSVRGRMARIEVNTYDTNFAFNLGYFFRHRIYGGRSDCYSLDKLTKVSNCNFSDFKFNYNNCSWFK